MDHSPTVALPTRLPPADPPLQERNSIVTIASPGRRLTSMRVFPRGIPAWVGLLAVVAASPVRASEPSPAAARFRDEIEPILAERCYGCHGNGIKKGGVTLDEFPTDEALLGRKELWHSVLKNVRAGLMPPRDKPQPTSEEKRALEDWIKRGAFDLDPADPDPGRVTLRRLNRVEYRETIRDLMGIDFRADEEFPADDTGYGFDNVGDVLTVSPLLLEKYMQAAETIVATAVPTVARVVKVRSIPGYEFRTDGKPFERTSLYRPITAEHVVKLDRPGSYRLSTDVSARGQFDFDPGRARLTFRLDDRELMSEEIGWGDVKKAIRTFDLELPAGEHRLTFELRPLVPAEQKRGDVTFRIVSVKLEGPTAESEWVRPDNFARFFDRDDPGTPDGRKAYARDVLGKFASTAFRRPVDARTLDRLVKIAEETYALPGRNVQQGVGQAMIAILASPRFLFRVEGSEPARSPRGFALVDEYALASRLSYFLWSTMPDDELTSLAGRGELRKNLPEQVRRMLADARSEALIRNFVGQWLQARDFEHFPAQSRIILRQDGLPRLMDDEVGELKRAMRQETEAYFGHVVRQDRPILELIDSDYAFVNGPLAKLYGIPGVEGREVRKVSLPAGSPRGGLLTQAGVLMITSNPGRTSPVKRGQFILENILGTPTPPPPPLIPSLEEALRGIKDREPTMREVMEVHRADPLCASCHNRMDPLGLAFENFNALGYWRDAERKQPIDASGKLVDGRTFQDSRELKQILKSEHKAEFYSCLAEKLMTYALGRGLDYYDVETVDQVVDRVDREGGRFSALLTGIIESAPFQKRRDNPSLASRPPDPGAKP